MRYRKHEDRIMGAAALLFKVLFVACAAAMVKGLILLASFDFLGAFLWTFGGFYALFLIVIAFILLSQR